MIRKNWVSSLLLVLILLFLVGCSPKQPVSTASSMLTPLEKALSSGTPTLAEFGRGTCIPCKEMEPVLDELASLYKDKLNVVIVSVDDYRDLTSRYGIMAIPTQIFFDSSGLETFRHIGFYPEIEIINQLKKMGIE
ncbi:MAG: thioredoxin family protein [Chloroflexi bacterium]|nr:thioredoxin family protein [Chloroflexota bacterium]